MGRADRRSLCGMIAEKQPKPAEVCSVCEALSNRPTDLNHRCNAASGGRRCSGIYKSGLTKLWDQCESCAATGKVGSQVCANCAGFGWKMYG